MTLTARGHAVGVAMVNDSENKSATSALSAEVRTAVRAELEILLAAPIFSQSNRCKSFLSHIVLETISGNANQLKERTVGISVFGRATDYDTGEDSIVRVTANDVRKRLGQFYRESPAFHPVQIDLPRGSYVPEFRIQPSTRTGKREAIYGDHRSPEESTASTPVAPPLSSPVGMATAKSNIRRHFLFWTTSVLSIIGVLAFAIWRGRTQKTPDIWASFIHANVPVLICIDTHDLRFRSAAAPDSQKFIDLVLSKQSIALDDAAVLSSMASILGRKGIPFRVVGADQTSLSDLRRQPAIFIGAIDNKWTLRLTQGLRYRIEVANQPGSGSDKEPIASIVDSEHQGSTPWTTDLSVPFTAWKSDYAIVAKMDDPTTGVPVLIEAGLGNPGSVAASELITSEALSRRLTDESSCQGKSNLEAVVETEIIDTKPGPPHVIRLACW